MEKNEQEAQYVTLLQSDSWSQCFDCINSKRNLILPRYLKPNIFYINIISKVNACYNKMYSENLVTLSTLRIYPRNPQRQNKQLTQHILSLRGKAFKQPFSEMATSGTTHHLLGYSLDTSFRAIFTLYPGAYV